MGLSWRSRKLMKYDSSVLGDIDHIAPVSEEHLSEAAVLELLRSELGAEVIGGGE
jgi:hypothetical protein